MQVCDVTDQADVDDLVASAAAGGGFHILANVAGILDDFTPADEVSDVMWDHVLAVNVTGSCGSAGRSCQPCWSPAAA